MKQTTNNTNGEAAQIAGSMDISHQNVYLVQFWTLNSSGSRNFGEGGGARNMKYKPPCTVAIFFMTIF